MRSKVADIPFIAAQAATCLRVAETCADAEISKRLVELAGAFADCARRLGADKEALPVIDRPTRRRPCGEARR